MTPARRCRSPGPCRGWCRSRRQGCSARGGRDSGWVAAVRQSSVLLVARRQRLLLAVQEMAADGGSVGGQRLGQAAFVAAREVADAPVELLEGVLTRGPVAVDVLHEVSH